MMVPAEPGLLSLTVSFPEINVTTFAGRVTVGAAETELGAAGDGAEVTFCGIVTPFNPIDSPGTTANFPAIAN